MKKLEMYYGAMADPIKKQLKKQGFKFDDKKVSVFQKEADAINQLRFGNHLLTDSMTDNLTQKLHKVITKHISEQNKDA